jgi:hypothetical protein
MSSRRSRRHTWVTGLLLACSMAVVVPSAQARTTATARVAGDVVAFESDRPVVGARVVLPGFGRATTTSDGSFAFSDALPVSGPVQRIQAVVTAPGFGAWTVSGLPLVAGDVLRLHAELRSTDWSHRVAEPEQTREGPTLPLQSGNTCTGWSSNEVPPTKIKVFLHTTGQSKQYDFQFYATHVLPREWIPSWDPDALAAGAVAVKTYAWYRAQPGHAYSTGSNCADVRDDTSDQVFDPTYALDSTSQAVYISMGSVLRRNGVIFLAQYWSGDGNNSSQDWKKCEVVTGTYAGRMSQWGTQVCAQNGMLWPDIVKVFYPDTKFTYLRNMVWNPSFEGGVGSTPWTIGSNAAVSVSNTWAPYRGNYSLLVTPAPSGSYASVRQLQPVIGASTTKYHTEVALRCTDTNATPCTITWRVMYMPSSGSNVGPTQYLTVHRDHAWHFYRWDPPAAGIAHVGVYAVFGSHQEFKVDSSFISTPYGGA